ncbi:SMP-30/gluconolactonase/LRE family protein [Amaricoccus solimangrovi]|uniref:SMP-30/gluconolactonase/LRE family protein n=1 Tax=Amaricoccus solimangrovi TaxID=2589815 RepID=A0A501WQL0_9RHOB|nr:SMP-30/gluconolactonase/LRE family protein [Amaricoccus solimangrovi]TPE49271.1 SMP-30/gluconolactonase/LRE family protein [Amaricoccus solimangrovi]
MWQPAESYPDPAIEVLAEGFRDLLVTNAAIERLHTGLRWAEGPVWFGDLRCLLLSDIPNDRMLKYEEETGTVSVFRRGNFTNGNTRDRRGRLVSCEHGTRRVTRTETDGAITVLADGCGGGRLNSPNDVVVKSDGAVWFTDPTFGIADYYEGYRAEPELPTNVYRLDPETGALDVVLEGFPLPNGLAFSPDESRLYVVQSAPPRAIHAFEVSPDGRGVGAGKRLIEAGEAGTPDGIRLDTLGNIWAGWGRGEGLNGVRVFAPDGEPIGHVHLPERCANLCFGGRYRTRLFMAASQSLYALHVRAEGVGY